MKHSSLLMAFLFILSSSLLLSAEEDLFDKWMGKDTAHWRFVTSESDHKRIEVAKKLYQRNGQAQFTQEGSFKIPPVVHFIWLGPRQFPPQSVENIRTWMAHHPEWHFKFWTDRDREPPCKGMEVVDVSTFHFSRLGRCYAASENFGEKSDLLRYEILFQEGGVYADHDANCLQSFAGMHRGYDFYCCFETPHEPFVGEHITCGNGVLGSRAAHPCVGKVIEIIDQGWEVLGHQYRGRDPHSQKEVVMQRTYIALTRALEEGIDLPGNVDIVLPASYFFSKSGMKSLYSKHFYATAWDAASLDKPARALEEERLVKQLDRKMRQLQGALAALVLTSLLCYFIYRRRIYKNNAAPRAE